MWCVSNRRAHRAEHRTRARRGLSLLEAVAALAIVGATAASVLATTGAGVRGAERARRAHEASALAEETLARVALLDDASLRALPDSLAGGTYAAPFDDYQYTTTLRGDVAMPGLVFVDVAIEWNGGTQRHTTALYRRAAASPRANRRTVVRPSDTPLPGRRP